MSCVIDSREDQLAFTDVITKDPILWSHIQDFTFQKLDLGDFLITKKDGSTLLIERKTINDFSRSLYDESGNGTFSSKLVRMSPLADERGLLIEGDYIRGDDGKLYFHTSNGMKATIQYSKFRSFIYHRQQEGVLLFHTRTMRETLHQLLLLQDDRGSSPATKVISWEAFFLLIPGVGRAGVEAMKKKYGSPAEALADVQNWPRANSRMMMRSDKW